MWNTILKNVFGPDSTWFWTAIQALGVVITLFCIYRQVSIGQAASMLEALLQLETKWTAKRMTKARIALCEEYNNPTTKGNKSLCPNSNAILIFFEELGLLVDLKVLNRYIVWERLSFVIDHYWHILEPKVREVRATDQDDTVYEKFEQLALAMRKIHAKHVGPHVIKTDQQLSAFAKEEVETLTHRIAEDLRQSDVE